MSNSSHDETMAELYRLAPALALQVMNDILEDPQAGQSEWLVVLSQIVNAQGDVASLAEKVNLNPMQLQRMLSPQGNPALSDLMAILQALGLRLAIQPLGKKTQG